MIFIIEMAAGKKEKYNVFVSWIFVITKKGKYSKKSLSKLLLRN